MTKLLGPLAIVAMLIAAPSHAVTINYELTSLGGTSYRYDYTLANDGSITADLSLFDIYFDTSLYDESSLTNLSTAPGWDILFLGSGIGVPAAFDAFATGPGIGIGESLGGFAVSFNWLGAGTPGAQSFQVYDSETFDLLGGGSSTLYIPPPPTSVPEPGTLGLFGLGLAVLSFTRRRKTA